MQPPQFCQYPAGPCDQLFDGLNSLDAFLAYPNTPASLARTMEETVRKLRSGYPQIRIRPWTEMEIAGQIIFCRVCQNLRTTRVLVADVTSLNFNVLFEVGYAIGLGAAVVTLRDATSIGDKRDFDELGLLDTLGYIGYEGSDELAPKLAESVQAARPAFMQQPAQDQNQPLYVIKSPFATDGLVKMMSGLKKSGLRFRSFDPKETSRLSLHDAHRQIQSSFGVAAHLMASTRRGARVHNARAAFLCGLAMAAGKHVIMLQEGDDPQPIDYRDVVKHYSDPDHVQSLLGPFIQPLYETFQSTRFVPITLPLKPLETIDFGDVAAENEINALKSYFVPTAQYLDVRRGHGRLVVGRKGTGKTAMFYGIRNAYWSSQQQLVLDLKPEGHQLTKLRESVLKPLSQGMQEHVLTAFWTYLLLMELAHKIIEQDAEVARRRPERFALYEEIRTIYGWDEDVEQGDFSERLMRLVENIVRNSKDAQALTSTAEVTQLIYSNDIRKLNDTLSKYLRHKDGVWLLFDNLDKGLPVDGATPEDVLLLRTLLEASRKLQRQLERNSVEFHAVVFIRNDIYEHLLVATPDKGKDTAVMLEWNDTDALQRLVHRRMMASTGHTEPFEQLWSTFFETHVGGEESFTYVLKRTMMRPRDLLRFLRQCVNVAVNRGHNRVTENDILQAQKDYSEDQLQEVSFELRDISPNFPDILYSFIGCSPILEEENLTEILSAAQVAPEELDKLRKLLLWFGFIGVLDQGGEERYAYEYHYGVSRMLHDAVSPNRFVIHPAFRSALGCPGFP